MSLYSLSNEQLLYIYHHMLRVRTTYERIIKTNTLHNSIMDTQMVVVMQLTEEMLEEIKKSEHFKMSISITDKLAPVAEMIQEAEPELAKTILNSFANHEDEFKNL